MFLNLFSVIKSNKNKIIKYKINFYFKNQQKEPYFYIYFLNKNFLASLLT